MSIYSTLLFAHRYKPLKLNLRQTNIPFLELLY